ncbi:NAD(P)/FAD-dependent oxidoreductase [Paraburkholderia sp. J8-2]|uniref:flavin-dependent monooxygenase QhpG n=1 Tax=Paraburkholderia sp. J8-2 TaxID=2805440 RepID=UPI002AB77C72|nr:FAD-dependent monooxygenase [Paraburkholderia sp. J8-2]
MTVPRIVVLGAGPAGATVAIGLAQLGYSVAVVGERRRFDAVEGVSARVLQGLQHAGLRRAAACALPPCGRTTCWNGEERELNHEYLIDRRRFDDALRDDMTAAGIEIHEATVREVRQVGERYSICINTPAGIETLDATFLVEARGRRAPISRNASRGPQSLSLLNIWQGRPGNPASAIESLPDGWAWMAKLPDGRCYWQVTLDIASTTLPARDALAAWCASMRETDLARRFFDRHDSEVRVYARSSSAVLSDETGGETWLRVGDAAMAVDPLSGNGIFQSLSSALQAPAVINTLLAHPDRAALALRFHQRRIAELFGRFARVGRDFYALEQQWPDRQFWRTRSVWPDNQPAHHPRDFSKLKIQKAPVLDGHLISEAEVVTCPDQPLGIWHLHGVPLAPIVNALRYKSAHQVLSTLPSEDAVRVQQWLESQGYPSSGLA